MQPVKKPLIKLKYKVVYDGFSYNKAYAPNNVSLIGKTGTAQIANPKGGYLKGEYDYIKSFAGLFPYEDPEYIVFISIKQLVGGTNDIAKIVNNVVLETAKTLNLVSNNTDVDQTKIIALSDYISKNVAITTDELKRLGLKPIVLGDGKYIINQYPINNQNVLVGSKVFILTNDTTYKMPDVIGWSTNEIISFCNLLGINYELNGYGIVKSVSVSSGDIIDKSNILVINLEKQI